MDAHAFGLFLKDLLSKKIKEYDTPLLSVSFDNIADGKRIAGIRDGLLAVLNNMDSVLKDFYDNKTSSSPTSNGDNSQ